MKKTAPVQRYVIMPKVGFDGVALKNDMLAPAAGPQTLKARALSPVAAPTMRVLDQIGDNGPKLVEMPPEGELSLRLSNPDLKIVPEVFYRRLWERQWVEKRPAGRRQASRKPARAGAKAVKTAAGAAASSGLTITIVDGKTSKPLKGVHVVLFTNFVDRIGQDGDTNAQGVVRLGAISPGQTIERAYVYGPPGYWGHYAADVKASSLKQIALAKVNPDDPKLLLNQLYGSLAADAGTGVTVAVIDTGVDGAHPALANVTGGLNCVTAETLSDPAARDRWGPAAKEGEHGTHVAGIIGGQVVGGWRGVAPGVKLRSYRVFPNSGGNASNFDIAKAIDAAVADGCGVINMSLGGGPPDALTKAAIDRALNAGAVVVAAAGNDGRKPVSYPAAFPECISVSAMGRKKSFPADSTGAADIMPPAGGAGGLDFVAAFSNFGSEIDAVGPGVEIVSTLPDGEFGPMSGTSMATPAVAGFTAYVLHANPEIDAASGAERSRKLKDALYSSCRPEGFGRDYEGFGLPHAPADMS
ncbi:MAG: S8 family serine peptidase [Methylobacteriaceae bacterium]|nr:S8 family serine peptidase [Rhodoblastus sp.]MCC0003995.1 S8 family serine peptidase [Methylobacteriaceae bacterium]